MWPSPRGSKSRQHHFDVFSFLWQGSLLTHLKGDKKPTNACSSSHELYNSSPPECHVWLPDSRERYGNRGQLPSQKEQFSPADREENITAVSFCLTSSEWQSLATEYEYTEEWRIPALYSWQLHLDMEDRSLYYSTKSSQILFPLSFFDLSFTNGDFSQPLNQRVF